VLVSSVRTIKTPHGDGRLFTFRARYPHATLLLTHGAGRGVDTDELQALAKALPSQGINVHLFDQPWVVAGRKVAPPPHFLDDGLIAAADQIRSRTPLVVGGRSAGARAAARTARFVGASGCLALAFPLRRPGNPERTRVGELTGAKVRTLVVQGERDNFGKPDEFPSGLDLAVVPEADHAFRVPKRGGISQTDALAVIVEATLEWMVREIMGNQ
jgi:predicted alpha/beta-hydrolase family hydrolase